MTFLRIYDSGSSIMRAYSGIKQFLFFVFLIACGLV